MRSGSSAGIGVPVCLLGVWGRRCGCVGVFPARALAFLPPSPALPACLPACHPINIALHNPGSVSARLDPLPQVDRLLLYVSVPRVNNIESFHLLVLSFTVLSTGSPRRSILMGGRGAECSYRVICASESSWIEGAKCRLDP